MCIRDSLLSAKEKLYQSRHSEILLKLLNGSVLKFMPEELQAIDDTEGSVNMIEEPDWNKFVFIMVCGPPDKLFSEDPLLSKNEYGKYCYNVTIAELKEDVELTLDSIYVMRYQVVRELIMSGKVQLI